MSDLTFCYRAECNSPMHDRIGYSDDIQDCMVQHSDWVGLVPDDTLQDIADARSTPSGYSILEWMRDIVRALETANVICERSCNEGDHLNYDRNDQLIEAGKQLRKALLDGLVNDE